MERAAILHDICLAAAGNFRASAWQETFFAAKAYGILPFPGTDPEGLPARRPSRVRAPIC